MALIEYDLFGQKRDKVQTAIDRLRAFEPEEGYFLAFSGGKDSQCIYHLAKMAGVKFDAHYQVTSVDPPELVQFIKAQFPDVHRDIPHDKDGKPVTMWSLIAQHTIPPTRKARYCCAQLKEISGVGRVIVTGVRWAESARRRKLHGVVNVKTKDKKLIKKALDTVDGSALNERGGLIMNDDNDETRRMVEHCFRTKRTMVNPIVDWTDDDVWEFLNDVAKVPHCKLYDPPYNDKRLGCIGCPMAGEKKRLADFERYPKYKAAYIMAFEKMIANHPGEIRVLNKRIPMDEMGGGGYSTGGFGSTETKSQRKISHSLSEANFIFRLWSENSYRRKSLRGTDDALVARTDQRKARRIP
jgi:phosphoadenosine phosphosulfate reductase